MLSTSLASLAGADKSVRALFCIAGLKKPQALLWAARVMGKSDGSL
jgi:hypothetical protein